MKLEQTLRSMPVLSTHDALRTVRRFLTVGMLNTVLDVALFSALHGLVAMPTLPANTLAYSAGIVNSFALHRRWTYAHQLR
ncbi:MAG: GtrA family protein, partial [Chloroflexi bacterium]|nr:GtrA family protein [Chloroflexota bacterium]